MSPLVERNSKVRARAFGQLRSAFGPIERNHLVLRVVTNVRAVAKRNVRAGAPVSYDRRLIAAEFNVVGQDIADPAEAQPRGLADRGRGSQVKHRAVDCVEMLADFLDQQVDPGEVGLERGAEKI